MSDWHPENDDLESLIKESTEHRRSWAIVAGLSKVIMSERKDRGVAQRVKVDSPSGKKPQNWADVVQQLEQRIIKQREQLRKIEEVRTFERESERLLVRALLRISGDGLNSDFARSIAADVLNNHQLRLGPRP